MCQSRAMNNKIDRLHERCFTIIYNGKTSAFADLLAKSGSVTIHIRNLQVLATEMFKVCKYEYVDRTNARTFLCKTDSL